MARDLQRRIAALEAMPFSPRLIPRTASPEALSLLERGAERLAADVPANPELWTDQHLAAIRRAADFLHRASSLRAGVDPDAPCHKLTDDPSATLAVARILTSVGIGSGTG